MGRSLIWYFSRDDFCATLIYMLTPTQEDYIEAIQRISDEYETVTVTALAERFGCKLPTVTRTIKRMVEAGYVAHEARGAVTLTREGRRIAHHLVHRHEDMVRFLELVLGLESEQAELDACQLEHGLSALTAQRLHHFLEHLERLPEVQRERLLAFKGRDLDEAPDFETIPDSKQIGWRG
ncbi:MAG: metal-dependent transcriptional regulator [Myxococcales bacterium]|nr:metal-dependent transcriptional regulator [Myxococcales bacterium]